MIIVKNKGVSTPIYINRQNVVSVETAERKEFVTQGEFDDALDTKQNKLIDGQTIKTINNESLLGSGNIELAIEGSGLPYLYIKEISTDVFEYAKGSDYDAVLDAIYNNQPYIIYAPAVLDYYALVTDVTRNFGQINANIFFHNQGNTHYYISYTLQNDSITRSVSRVDFASAEDLSEKGVNGIVVRYNPEFNEYTPEGISIPSLIYAIQQGKSQYAIYLPSDNNEYKIAAEQIRVEGDVIKCKTIDFLSNPQTITSWEIGEDEFGFSYIIKGESEIITTDVDLTGYATEEWVENKGYLTSIPSEYVTETELNNKKYVNTTTLTNKLATKQDTLVSGNNIKTINGNSILGSGDIVIEGGGDANIVELTQSEYDALATKDEDTLYVITDATGVDVNLKTINGQSLIGEGNIVIEGGTGGGGAANIVELTQAQYDALANKDADTLYLITDVAVDLKTINGVSVIGGGDISVATEEWVLNQINDKLGAIETALSNLIGQ